MQINAPRSWIPSLCLLFAACPGKDDGDATATGSTTGAMTGVGPTSDGPSTTDTTTGAPEPTTAATGDDTTAATADDTTATTGDDTTATTGDDTGGGELVCPAAIDQAILACVADLQSDPELAENNFLLDLLLMCSDAEPVADDYDAHCAQQPTDPICALDYPGFIEAVLPECIARAQEALFADVCLFPESYAELLFTPAIALMDRRFVTSSAELEPIEHQQILLASADMGFPAATVEEALLATDDDGFDRLTVLDVGTDRALVAYSAHYGDTRVGRVFFRNSLTIVGAIEDSVFTRCAVERAIEGQPCTSGRDCEPDHMCIDILNDEGDVVLAPGTCVWPASLSGEGASCTTHDDCDPSTGLLCLDALADGDGQCRPGWMRRSFPGPDAALVANGTLTIPILSSGLATVPNAAHLDLNLFQDGANELELRLVNPLGTVTTIITTDATVITLDLEPINVPSDESAGGTWHLVVEDLGGNASGGVTRVALTLDTRWD